MRKLMILQTVDPDYRKRLFDILHRSLENHFLIYAGEDYFEDSVQTDSTIYYLKSVRNYYFFNRRLLFQYGMWNDAVNTDVLVIELNPRIISNWILLLFRRILGRETVLWGHVWPRKGKNSPTEKVRDFMRRLGDKIIAYTKTQKVELQKKMLSKEILFAPNALYFEEEMKVIKDGDICNIIFVGRLTRAKKPQILVEAFSSIINKIPNETNLIILGDGPERNKLLDLVKKLKVEGRVSILGHVGDYETLSKYFSHSLVSISSGYIGLSITQSFGFGVPILISENENHSPEIEAAEIGVNSEFFITNNKASLADKILEFYKNKDFWINQRKIISEKCKKTYSIEVMSKVFIDLVK
jgi:glycosyltransferase involved in cell wall biosynthesis